MWNMRDLKILVGVYTKFFLADIHGIHNNVTCQSTTYNLQSARSLLNDLQVLQLSYDHALWRVSLPWALELIFCAATRFPSKLYFPFLAPFLFPSSSEKVYFLPKKDSWLVYFLFWCFNPSFLSFYCFMFSILLGMGGSYFSLAQWQELELQALIYRYMLAGAAVPPELLQPIKKSLLHSPPYFLHHPLQQYSYYQPACKCC